MTTQQSIKHHSKHHSRQLGFIRARHLAVLIVLAGLLVAGLKGWQIYSRAQALRQDVAELGAAAGQPVGPQIEQLGPLLARTHADAQALRGQAAPLLPLTGWLGWLPGYGGDLAAATDLLDLAVDLSGAAEDGYIALMPALRPLPAGQTAGQGLVQRLGDARPDLLRVKQTLERAADTLARLPVGQLSPELRAPLGQLAPLLPAARDGVDLALALPELLGAQGRHEYLLIAQNPDELRPTGGLITAAGVLAIEQGRVVEFTLADSGALNNFASGGPYPSAPAPLQRYMGIDLWAFQDANWSPDFPTAAHAISDLFRRGQGREIHDVLAIDPAGLQLLVGALGPLEVEGAAQPITAATMLPYLRNSVFFAPAQAGAASEPWWVHRKAFMAPLGRALLARFEAARAGAEWLAAFGALRQALDARHLQVALRQPLAAAVLERRGWDGAVRASNGDFLLLNSANLGYNKVSPLVQPAITYTADLSAPANPIGELTVRQHNGARGPAECDQTSGLAAIVAAQRYEELMAGCAWLYLRALIPEGSRLISALGSPTPGAWLVSGQPDAGAVELGPGDAHTSAIATFLTVPPGEARRVFARYQLPASVLTRDAQGWHYRLTLQKQAGTPALSTTVRVRLPRGAALVSASLPVTAQAGQDVTFQLTLARDQVLELTFAAPYNEEQND